MGRIVAVIHLTLDGVMQAPSGLDEDTCDDFRYGGWSPPYGDAVMASSIGPGTRSDRSEDGGHCSVDGPIFSCTMPGAIEPPTHSPTA
jgi:hypothetical protein